MSDKIILSIIIPVYNCEKYIVNCINSIIKNKSSSLEIICVDDGSIDSSKSKILSIKDYRVKYIYQKNNGVSSARNTGIKVAHGEYLSFVDSDDYVDSLYIDSIFNYIEKYKASLIIFNHYRFSSTYKIVEKDCGTKQDLYKMACEQRLNAPWDKVFCRKILCDNSLLFDESMKTSEDGEFFIKYLRYVDKFIVIKEPLYYYRINPEGAVQKPKIDYIYDQKKMLERIISFEKAMTLPSSSYATEDVAIERMFYLIANLKRNGVSTHQIKQSLSNSKFMSLIRVEKLSVKGRIKFSFMKFGMIRIASMIVR